MQVTFLQSFSSSAAGRSLQKRFWEEDWLKRRAKVRILAVLANSGLNSIVLTPYSEEYSSAVFHCCLFSI